jgi:hypothetical protein
MLVSFPDKHEDRLGAVEFRSEKQKASRQLSMAG